MLFVLKFLAGKGQTTEIVTVGGVNQGVKYAVVIMNNAIAKDFIVKKACISEVSLKRYKEFRIIENCVFSVKRARTIAVRLGCEIK